ncbi:hypothetical protein ACVWWI_001417 [Bradyrhizobium sp. USDA 3686]|jgi:hypothetical protein|nr:hypothetical protein [Bradyrhizobium canariense]
MRAHAIRDYLSIRRNPALRAAQLIKVFLCETKMAAHEEVWIA